MSNDTKITAAHLRRYACVYVRQSSAAQVQNNRESTERQYALVERAVSLGWQREHVTVIDEDLGVSGGGLVDRVGFARLTSEVGLARVGIVLGLEVSRLARNNADWYRLLDLYGVTDTLIGDGDGSHTNGVARPWLVMAWIAIVEWSPASKSVQSIATTISSRPPITNGAHCAKRSHGSTPALLSNRSTCLIECLLFSPRAAASPCPIE